ncbi:unnamed protein product [Schistosoma intercalatum]|nr:unnamed protein product [Schistosoma intercalatum]
MAVDATADADIQKEFFRQREHLERSVAGLRKKLARDSEVHRSDYVRIMQENVTLIQEIDNLRTELKLSRNHINDLEALLGFNRKDGNKTKQLLIQLNKSHSNSTLLESDYEQAKRILKAQQLFINTLQMKLDQSIQSYNNNNNNTNDLLKELQSAAYSIQSKSSSSSSPPPPPPPITTIMTTTVTTETTQSRPYSSSMILPPINDNNNKSITDITDQKTFKSGP